MAAAPVVRLLARAETSSERELVAAAVEELAKLFGGRGSCILIQDAPRVVYSTIQKDIDIKIDLDRYPELQAAFETGQVAVIDNAHADDALKSVRGYLPNALRSVVVLPLRAGARNLGAIMVQSPTEISAAEAQLEFAAVYSRIFANIIELGELRRARSSSPEERGSRPLNVDINAPHRRVLVMDDDDDHAEVLATRLRKEGFEVDVATSGKGGLTQALGRRPDLILLDVYMPDMDGFEVAKRLNDEPLTCDIPILFLSGMDDLVTRVRELHQGDVDFLAKPYSFAELLARVERALAQWRERTKLRVQAHVDELTGLGNLRALQDRLAFEESGAKRYGTSVAIVVIDFDKLKLLNDQHGHMVGSQALAAVGKVLHKAVRETDLAARYGGDEFVVLLSHASLDEGIGFAERITQQIRGLEVGNDKVKISVSCGVASLTPDKDNPIGKLLKNADTAVYEAKRLGGNQVAVFR